MKCIFCKEAVGFFKSYHEDCYNKTQTLLWKMETVVNQYNRKAINSKDAKKELMELALSERLYQNCLEREILDMAVIRTNEIIIYVESGLCIYESKNRSRMDSTGYRYEKKPVWSESNHLIGNNVSIAVTDKCVYMLLEGKAMVYQYNKIVNIGFDDKWGWAYFDVKTASPFPHRFTIRPLNKREKSKAQNVCLFLNCLIGF